MSPVKILAIVLMLVSAAVLTTLRARHAAPKVDAPAAAAEQLTTTWAATQRLLAAYEQEQAKLRVAVIKQRQLFQDGEVSKSELFEMEQSLISVLARIQEVRRLLAETEIAAAEAEMKRESSEPALSEAEDAPQAKRPLYADMRRAPWSIREAPNIDRYFFQTFGHNLPVSALGQTPTHDRMRFDHRDAMDVALHPDSVEGRALIAHLRRSGVPFIAFRTAAVGASTGAHIHIGRPSRRMAANPALSH
jgi:hypothetical protein